MMFQFHFTAMGALIVWCWMTTMSSGVLAANAFVENKPGRGLWYVLQTGVLIYLLLVR